MEVDRAAELEDEAAAQEGDAHAWRYLSLSWRAPMREPEPEKVPIGLPLPDMTMDQFMDLEDSCRCERRGFLTISPA